MQRPATQAREAGSERVAIVARASYVPSRPARPRAGGAALRVMPERICTAIAGYRCTQPGHLDGVIKLVGVVHAVGSESEAHYGKLVLQHYINSTFIAWGQYIYGAGVSV